MGNTGYIEREDIGITMTKTNPEEYLLSFESIKDYQETKNLLKDLSTGIRLIQTNLQLMQDLIEESGILTSEEMTRR